MRDIQLLIRDLDSASAAVRDKAALELMEVGSGSAVEPLIRAILLPANVNHRGTLVYALSAFNCEPHLELLVDLALTGNFEVSLGAFSIIQNTAQLAGVRAKLRHRLSEYDGAALESDDQKAVYEDLVLLAGPD